MITPQMLLANPGLLGRQVTAQTMRDQRVLLERICTVAPLFCDVRKQLEGKTKRTLSNAAAGFIEKYEIPAMDRLEKRTFDGMVTWYCRYNVLNRLDMEDARILGVTWRGNTDPFTENPSDLPDPTDDLFAPLTGDGLEMNKTGEDTNADAFSFDV